MSDRLDELEQRIRELEAALEERDDRIEALQQELDDRPEVPEGLDLEEATEAVTRLREALGLEMDDEAAKWKRKYKEEREKREAAEARAESPGDRLVSEEFDSAIEFLKHEAVQGQVQKVAEQSQINEGHFWDALFAMADDAVGSVHPSDLTSVVDIHQDNIGKMLRRLAEKNIVTTEQDGRKKKFRLNVDGLSGIVEAYQKRQEIQKHRKEVTSG